MARSVWRVCPVCGDLHDLYDWPDNHRPAVYDNRSDLAAPSVIRDEMAPLEAQHDGQIYTSKRAIRRSYRENGMIEVGDDKSVTTELRAKRPKGPADVRGAKESLQKAASRYNLTSYRKDELPTGC